MAGDKSGMSGTQITVALIGASAVIGSALIANSDRLMRDAPTPSPAPMPSPTASPSVAEPGQPQPLARETAAPVASVANLGGAWRGDDGTVMTFVQDGDRIRSEQSDGDERVTIEGQVSGRAVKLWVDYFRASTGGLGLRIMTCDGLIDENAQQVRYSCLNPQTNVTSRALWTRA